MDTEGNSNPCLAIFDFGGQYTKLIARRFRALGGYAIILPHCASFEKLMRHHPVAVVLSGGPASVRDNNAPRLPFKLERLRKANIPILGLCYGLQYIVEEYGGGVKRLSREEYGAEQVFLQENTKSELLQGLPASLRVWMSHADSVSELPPGFNVVLKSQHAVAALQHAGHQIYGLQFHPEVQHSEHGDEILKNFMQRIAGLPLNWKMENVEKALVRRVRNLVGKRRVLVAVSGGVDSTVLAVLLRRAVGARVRLVFVDNGLLRLQEAEAVKRMFETQLDIPLQVIGDGENFLKALAGITDPEEKRRIIGRRFIEVFMPLLQADEMLAQGTLYTDVIESVKTSGPSQTIKTHHNRVEEVLALGKQGRLVEPFAELFKDEVRAIGVQLGISNSALMRHPFPGPGLAVRILGEITPTALSILRQADAIYLQELKAWGYYEKLWQCFAVFLPLRSVSVVGDRRGYGYVIALRAVHAGDGMTADFELFSKEFIAKVSARIIGEVEEVARVVLDVSQKPPATIEWE